MGQNTQSSKTSARAAAKRRATIKLAIIILVCTLVVIALIFAIVGLVVLFTPEAPDDRIIDNVYAGGINLGGMTQDEAKNALHLATDNTFSVQNMVVTLPDATLTISPEDSGAALDVDAVVEEAYEYGRTGTEEEQRAIRQSAANTERTIALLPYLNLNLSKIHSIVGEFCNEHSSVKTSPSVELVGTRPTFDPNYPSRPVTHQIMYITMGTPEYTLKVDPLYNLILDYYSLNQLELDYADHQTLLAPDHSEPPLPNAQQIFNQYCVPAKDAVLDETTYEVTGANKEVYGYGFDVDALQQIFSQAKYGQVVQVQLKFLYPKVTAKSLTKDLFKDTLCTGITSAALGANWNTNLQLSCKAIDGYVIKPNGEFSFNLIVGQPAADKGYKKAPGYVGEEDADVLGSGISQTASALYACVLKADLEILERHNHTYMPKFSTSDLENGCLGLDAYVDGYYHDLRFRNNTGYPIRIKATADGGTVKVELIGTNKLNYFIELEIEQVYDTYPNIVHQYVDKNNILGYKDGKELQSPIIGYGINSFKVKYNYGGGMISRDPVVGSVYECRDQILAKFPSEKPIEPDDPVDPGTPDDTDKPNDQDEPIVPDNNIDQDGPIEQGKPIDQEKPDSTTQDTTE